MRPNYDDIKRWKEADELLSSVSIALFGFDTTKLDWRQQEKVEKAFLRQWELEEELERRSPKPKRKFSKVEELEQRRISILFEKIERIVNGRPSNELTNEELSEIVSIMKAMTRG